MDIDQQLAQNITSESKAYGYTLSIWGGGSILGQIYGPPNLVQTFLYVGGALVAFGLIVLLTFNQLFVDASLGSEIPVPSMFHLIATLGTLVVGFVLAKIISIAALPQLIGFLLVGFQVTLLYNFLLPAETGFFEKTIQSKRETDE